MNLTQQIINGLVLGHAYALVAIGWTLLLGVARLVNFGHGQMYMVGAFVTWWAVAKAGVPYVLAVPIAMGVGAVFGLVMQRVMLKATFEQNLVSIMIMTLGFGYVIRLKGNTRVGAADGTVRPAQDWVGQGGRARPAVPGCGSYAPGPPRGEVRLGP